MRRAVLLIAAATAAVFFAGCTFSRNFAPICSRHDLSEAQLQAARQTIPPGATRGELGRQRIWIPLIYSSMGVNLLLRGNNPETYPPAWTLKAREQWLQGSEIHTFGPLMSLWAQARNAQFHMDGANFGYYRKTLVLYGILWWDKLGRPYDENMPYLHTTGFLFGGFGYGNEQTLEQQTKYIRFFWIPIPVSRTLMPRAEPAPAPETPARPSG